MSADYFAPFNTVRYEGPDSTNDLAYRWHDKDRVVLGKRMEEHLRFAVCFWHSFCWPGSDVFGAGTFTRPWHAGANDAVNAAAKREAAMAFIAKLDVPFYCFHDVDVMADAETVGPFRKSFAEAVDHLEELQARHGRKLLSGTANLFGHPRYMAGASTNPDPEVYTWAAMQVRDCLEATHRLGGDKVRRQSIDAEDLFHGHIGGIDTVAKGLLRAAAVIEDGQLDAFRKARYAGWQGELGQSIRTGSLALVADLCVEQNLAPVRKSGRQEWLENLLNRF